MTHRRDFITLLGGAAAAWPVTAWRQQPRKLPMIGLLGVATAASCQPGGVAAGKAAPSLGSEIVTLPIRRAEDIVPAFDAIKGHAQAVERCRMICSIVRLTLSHRD